MIRPLGDNPEHLAAYLDGLNRCFPGWGKQARFDWCYRRSRDPHPAAMLVAERGGEFAAGLGVVFRWVARGDEPAELIGILSGAWTHPEARGQGLFGQLIDAATTMARAQGATMALAFVTGDRGSVGQLGRRSARVIEAGWFASAGGGGPVLPDRTQVLAPGEAAREFAALRNPADRVSIVYDPPAWREQMLAGGGHRRVVRLGDGSRVVAAGSDLGWTIIDALGPRPGAEFDLAGACAALSGPVSIYVSDPPRYRELAEGGWERTHARIFQFALNPSRYAEGCWQISAGDRI